MSVDNIDNKIIEGSKKYIGLPYVWCGEEPETGFDCSGYVQWVLKESIDLYIQRTSKQQYDFLKSKTAKGFIQIKAGDILLFRTLGSAVSHVGIALKNKTFIHAPNSDSLIREEKLEGYWEDKFVTEFNS